MGISSPLLNNLGQCFKGANLQNQIVGTGFITVRLTMVFSLIILVYGLGEH
jgi:hypothetical protein